MFFAGCAQNQPQLTQSAKILIKTPSMKFYDVGFVSRFQNHTEVQIYSAGASILQLKIYKDRVCRDTFECQSLKEFNASNLHKSYAEDFLYQLFQQSKINYTDTKNRIRIKVIPN
ncbi:MAG: hypothetical protein U9N30_07680 [Campylobacterota bacterium]|nr:hypothetical protein [Campylobacterota bacterium]